MPAIDTAPAAPAASEQIVDAFDLRQMRSAPGMSFSVVRARCPEGRPGEIVVCAPDPDRERVQPLPQDFEMPSAVPRLETKLDENTSADVRLQAQAFPDGSVSQRVMVGVKRKF